MKTTSTIVSAAALLFASITSAFASGSTALVDTSLTYNSGILVLAFAGFLALVVVVQLIPAVISLYSMIKSAASAARSKEDTASAATK